MVVRKFLPLYVLPDRGKSQNTGILGHFGLGRPWHLTKSRAPAENGKPQFPGARGPEIEKKSYHAIEDGCPYFFFVLRFAQPDPQGQEIAKYEYDRPFWPRTDLGT